MTSLTSEREPAASEPGEGAPVARRLVLDDTWIYTVSVLADRVARRVAETVQSVSSLNQSQWRVLAAVADTPGRTASEVVAVTPMDKGIVSRAVTALVSEGLIARQSSQADARRAHLTLTPRGAEVYDVIVAALQARGALGEGALAPADAGALNALVTRAIADY